MKQIVRWNLTNSDPEGITVECSDVWHACSTGQVSVRIHFLMHCTTSIFFLHGHSPSHCPSSSNSLMQSIYFCFHVTWRRLVIFGLNQTYFQNCFQSSVTQRPELLIVSRDGFSWFTSRPELGMIIDRIQVSPVTLSAIHLFSPRISPNWKNSIFVQQSLAKLKFLKYHY